MVRTVIHGGGFTVRLSFLFTVGIAAAVGLRPRETAADLLPPPPTRAEAYCARLAAGAPCVTDDGHAGRCTRREGYRARISTPCERLDASPMVLLPPAPAQGEDHDASGSPAPRADAPRAAPPRRVEAPAPKDSTGCAVGARGAPANFVGSHVLLGALVCAGRYRRRKDQRRRATTRSVR